MAAMAAVVGSALPMTYSSSAKPFPSIVTAAAMHLAYLSAARLKAHSDLRFAGPLANSAAGEVSPYATKRSRCATPGDVGRFLDVTSVR